MATTLPLIATVKIDTRRDGAISWARVRIILDGAETGADFRARLGEEPVVIDGDTITVSDAQVEQLRRILAATRTERVAADAALAGLVDAKVSGIESGVAAGRLPREIADELIALVRRHPHQLTGTLQPCAAVDAYNRIVRRIAR